MSAMSIFVPGIVWSAMIGYHLRKKTFFMDKIFWTTIVLTPLTSMLFPFTVIFMKLIALFNSGEELKKVCDTFTYAEGQVEAFAQTG